MFNITTLHVIESKPGCFVYVGRVPVEIGYIDPTPEKVKAAREFGGRFGPKIRSFSTREDAIAFAENHGYTVEVKK
jgi:hypothetical protein